MEADFVEIEVNSIPKALHRVVLGAKGATVKQLRKEFKVEIEVPEEKSRHTTIVVGGTEANVKKCIAKMESLVAAEQSASGATAAQQPSEDPKKAAKEKKAAEPTVTPNPTPATAATASPNSEKGSRADANNNSNGKGGKKKEDTAEKKATNPPSSSSSSSLVTVASFSFSFEKSAHAKLRGANNAKQTALEALLLKAATASSPSPQQQYNVSLQFPPPSELTANTITVALQTNVKAGTVAADSGVHEKSIRCVEAALAAYLSENKLAHHHRGGGAGPEAVFPPSSSPDADKEATARATLIGDTAMGSPQGTATSATSTSTTATAEGADETKKSGGGRRGGRNNNKKKTEEKETGAAEKGCEEEKKGPASGSSKKEEAKAKASFSTPPSTADDATAVTALAPAPQNGGRLQLHREPFYDYYDYVVPNNNNNGNYNDGPFNPFDRLNDILWQGGNGSQRRYLC